MYTHCIYLFILQRYLELF